jgi:ubiquinone/menaquinone biosynthesis C-methylase UbiE
MADTPSLPLYESAALQAATGPTLRPGGLELTKRALALCALPAGARVADIGCGMGATVDHLRRHHRLRAVGLDRSAGMLGRARQKDPRLPLVRGDAACLPFEDGRLSAVLCECFLTLVADMDAAWREICRVLAPGGFLILTDIYARAPHQAAGLRTLPGTSCLKGARSRDEIVARMQRSGFALLAWEDHSEALKRLAAKLVLACGSLQSLWGAVGDPGGAPACAAAVRQARLGYFLSIARKGAPP